MRCNASVRISVEPFFRSVCVRAREIESSRLAPTFDILFDGRAATSRRIRCAMTSRFRLAAKSVCSGSCLCGEQSCEAITLCVLGRSRGCACEIGHNSDSFCRTRNILVHAEVVFYLYPRSGRLVNVYYVHGNGCVFIHNPYPLMCIHNVNKTNTEIRLIGTHSMAVLL